MKRGDVVWAALDKRRPAIVVSTDRRNDLATDVVLVPCSRSGRLREWHVALRRGEAGLPKDCFAKCEQVTTLPKSQIEAGEIGRISDARLVEVERGILSALGILVARHA